MAYLSCAFGIVILTGGIFLAKSVSNEVKQAAASSPTAPAESVRPSSPSEWTISTDLSLTESANHAAVLPNPIPYHPRPHEIERPLPKQPVAAPASAKATTVPVSVQRQVEPQAKPVTSKPTSLPPIEKNKNEGKILPRIQVRKYVKPKPKPQKKEVIYFIEHRIVDGDDLRSLAARYLGDQQQYQQIFEVNRKILPQPDLLPIGKKIRIPIKKSGGRN